MDAHYKPDLIKVEALRDTGDTLEGLVYLAAYLEADGQISFYSTATGYFQGNIGIEQKDRAILEEFRKQFGGKVNLKARQGIWVWQLFGHQAAALLKRIRPYMRTYRTEKADRFIAFWATKDMDERIRLLEEDRNRTQFHQKRLSDLAHGSVMRQSDLVGENHEDS